MTRRKWLAAASGVGLLGACGAQEEAREAQGTPETASLDGRIIDGHVHI